MEHFKLFLLFFFYYYSIDFGLVTASFIIEKVT